MPNMNTHQFLLAVILIILGQAQSASAQPECGYEVVIVHPDPCGPLGPLTASGRGINSFGQTTGYRHRCSDGYSNAISWTPEAGMIDVPMPGGTFQSRAADINDNGWSVGWVAFKEGDFVGHAFLNDGEQTITLGTLPGGNYSKATAINNSGQIAGYWGNNITGMPTAQAIIWQDGEMIDLGSIIGALKSRAFAINEDGAVAGRWKENDKSELIAFIWDDGEFTSLGPIPGGFTSEGLDISDNGFVVGTGWKFDEKLQVDLRHAFLWAEGKMIDLGVLPGQTVSTAVSVNNAGQVIGHSSNFGAGGSWFIWEDGVMSDLNDLVPAECTIASAWAINNEGMIAGSGNGAEGGFPGIALLIPNPRPVGDLDLNCEVDLDDLVMLLDNWGLCDKCTGDLDGNGIVSTNDLLILFANWG